VLYICAIQYIYHPQAWRTAAAAALFRGDHCQQLPYGHVQGIHVVQQRVLADGLCSANTCEQEYEEVVKQSTGHTHTGHTDRENTPDTGTHTRTTRAPNEHLPQALNNAQRWRDDGACHLPRPGGWPRRSQHER